MNVPLSDAAPRACQIRAARVSDVDALTELLVRSFHRQEGWAGLFYPFWRMALREDIYHRLQRRSPHYCCLVAVVSTAETAATEAPTLVGTVEMSLRPQFSLPISTWFRSFPYLSNLAVLPAYRRQGIASRMITLCETTALEWGYQDLYLHALDDNNSACALYRKLNFSVCHTEVSLSTLLLGQPRQVLLHKTLCSNANSG